MFEKDSNEDWFLEGVLEPGKTLFIRLRPLPFVIGRDPSCHLSLSSKEVSRVHAQIEMRGEVLWVKDLNSTNGSFVNRRRLNLASPEMPLDPNDILHFGTLEFRLTKRKVSEIPFDRLQQVDASENTVFQLKEELPRRFIECDKDFMEMLDKGLIIPMFNPVAKLNDKNTVAYEAIGRCNYKNLPSDEESLFEIAKHLGYEQKLSELIRETTSEKLNKGLQLPNNYDFLFLHIHGKELDIKTLIKSLQKLRRLADKTKIVLLIKDRDIQSAALMKHLKETLDATNMYLGCDHFNGSQARLEELATMSIHFIKFDEVQLHSFIQQNELHKKLRATIKTAKELKILTIATGVDTQEQVNILRNFGFEWGQGSYFGLD